MPQDRKRVYDRAGRYLGYQYYDPKGMVPPKEPVREEIVVELRDDVGDYLDGVQLHELGGKIAKLTKDYSEEERRGAFFQITDKDWSGNGSQLSLLCKRLETDKEFTAKVAAYNKALDDYNKNSSDRAAKQLAAACEQEARDRALYEELKKKYGNEQ